MSAPPGGKSSIGFDDSQEVSKHVTQPKNSAAAAKVEHILSQTLSQTWTGQKLLGVVLNYLQARDLSTNFMAPEVPSSDHGNGKNGKPVEGEVENQDQKAEPPRPKGAPNR